MSFQTRIYRSILCAFLFLQFNSAHSSTAFIKVENTVYKFHEKNFHGIQSSHLYQVLFSQESSLIDPIDSEPLSGFHSTTFAAIHLAIEHNHRCLPFLSLKHQALPLDITSYIGMFVSQELWRFYRSDIHILGLSKRIWPPQSWHKVEYQSQFNVDYQTIRLFKTDFEFIDFYQPQQASQKPFALMTHPITQRQYQAVTGHNPSTFRRSHQASDHPVETVSANEALLFIKKLNQELQKQGFHGNFFLPTSSQWDFAAKQNLPDDFQQNMEDYIHINNNSTTSIFSKERGKKGLWMMGNVWDMTSTITGIMRISRGGGYCNDYFPPGYGEPLTQRRTSEAFSYKKSSVGFRLARYIDDQQMFN